MNTPIKNRYEFVFLFDVKNGNPNGDPDNGNAPRMDFETQLGWVSDVCLKRKIRNFVNLIKIDDDGKPEAGYDVYVKERSILNQTHQKAYDALGLKIEAKTKAADKNKMADQARNWMCQTYFDIRMFGAVMTTGVNCGQVRGPVQIAFSTSIDPIASQEQSLTRMAVTTEAESEKQGGSNRTMGRKDIVPYGLYRCHGFISAPFAQQTGFSEEDLELLFQSLENMFDHDHSAARGEMNARRLIVFKHESKLGNSPSHKLFDSITVERAKKDDKVPRSFSDYKVDIDTSAIPDAVKVIERI
jgi:CRISPR-associated protein Csd2